MPRQVSRDGAQHPFQAVLGRHATTSRGSHAKPRRSKKRELELAESSGARPWVGTLRNVIYLGSVVAIRVPILQMSKERLREKKSSDHTAGQLQTQACPKAGSSQTLQPTHVQQTRQSLGRNTKTSLCPKGGIPTGHPNSFRGLQN